MNINIFFLKIKRWIKAPLMFLKMWPDDRSYRMINAPVVYLAANTKICHLPPHAVRASAQNLPSELLIKPGEYLFQKNSYLIPEEGLCRFIFPEKNNQQRIVYEHDVHTLLSSMAWMVTHGERDDHLSFDALMTKAKSQKLVLTCEAVSRFTVKLLTSLDISARIVGARTLEQWNTYNDGHYLVEVYRHDLAKWVVYDVDHDVYFSYDNKILSLLEWLHHLQDDYQIHYLSQDIRAVSTAEFKKYDFTFIHEDRLADLKRWYQRIMQFTFIEQPTGNFSCDDFDSIVINHYPAGAFPPISCLSKTEFSSKLYAI